MKKISFWNVKKYLSSSEFTLAQFEVGDYIASWMSIDNSNTTEKSLMSFTNVISNLTKCNIIITIYNLLKKGIFKSTNFQYILCKEFFNDHELLYVFSEIYKKRQLTDIFEDAELNELAEDIFKFYITNGRLPLEKDMQRHKILQLVRLSNKIQFSIERDEFLKE